MSDIKIQMQEFSSETTFHGMKYVGGKKYGIIRRLIWFIVCIGTFSLFVVSFIQTLKSYYKYESITGQSVQTVSDLILPAITICPNYFINRQSIIKHYPNQADNIISYANLMLKDQVNYQDLPKDFIHFLEQESAIIFQIKALSDSFMVGCHIQHQDINCSEYTTTILTDRSACKTFNSKEVIEKHGQIYLSGSGQENDVKFLLDLEQNDSISAFLEGYGFTLLVHHPSIHPRMSENSFAISTGKFVFVGIRQFQFEYLGTPYSAIDCVTEEKIHHYEKYSVTGKDYSQDSCLVKCLYEIVYDCDNCSYFSLGNNSCTVFDLFTCVPNNTASFSYSKVEENCAKCLPTCEEIKYDVTISTMDYPNKYFHELVAVDSYNLPVQTKEEMTDRYVCVSVYFGSTQNIVVTQRVALNMWQVMASIGGNMGLFLGGSILSMLEFLDLISTICMGKIGGLFGNKKKSQGSGPFFTGKVDKE